MTSNQSALLQHSRVMLHKKLFVTLGLVANLKKTFTIVIFESRVVNISNLLVFKALES